MEPIQLFCLLFAFLAGLLFGSFANVLIWRIPQKMPFAKGRSICPDCGKTIKPYDLIPLVSYLLLRGKCRHCKHRISPRYPLIELVCGILFALCYLRFDPLAGFMGLEWIFQPILYARMLVAMFVSVVLLVITMIDHDTMEIPNGLQIALILPALVGFYAFAQGELFSLSNILLHGIGLICVSLPMYLLICAIPNAFGGGDVKLFAVCGFMLGWKNTLLALFISIILGGGYAVYLLLSKKIEKKGHMAFGPYICVGLWVAMLYGDTILNAYINYFFA